MMPHELRTTGVEPQTLKLHAAVFCLAELVPDVENAAQVKGAALGVAVAATEGVLLGTTDGKSVGEAAGLPEGERDVVGLAEGEREAVTGRTVGLVEGARLGAAETLTAFDTRKRPELR